MPRTEAFVTNLELRESNPDGSAGGGLTHSAAGLFLLHVLELAAEGEPRGGAVVVHGAGDHGRRYLPLAQVLAEGGWAVALPDMRGHGESEGERGHSGGVAEAVRDLADVQAHLAYRLPDAPFVFIGCGLGGLQCLAHAAQHPDDVAAVVAVAPLLAPRFELPQPPKGLKKLFARVGPSTPGRLGLSPELMTADPAERAAWSGDPLVHDRITLRAGESALAAAREGLEGFAALPMPVLLLQGSADRVTDPEVARRLEGGNLELRVFDGLAHDLFHETRAPEVMQCVRDWLDERVPGA